MIRNSDSNVAVAYRSLRDCPDPSVANVEITLFANYYGSVKKSHKFNDPALYTDKSALERFWMELKGMKLFRRNKKHA